MAGRPLKGSFNERGEVCDASVPRRRGDKPRVQATFVNRAAAEPWVAAQIERLYQGLEAEEPVVGTPGYLPAPARVTRAASGPPPAARAAVVPARGFEYWARRWHRERYIALHSADVERTEELLRDMELHLFPVFGGLLPCDSVEEARDTVVSWVRTMAGYEPLPDAPGFPLPSRSYSQKTVKSLLWALSEVLLYSHALGADVPVVMTPQGSKPAVTVGIHAMKKRGSTRRKPPLMSMETTAEIAARLHVVHALVLWIMRVAGLRIGEAYGLVVANFVDDGVRALLLIEAQGGRTYRTRDDERTVTTRRKKRTKTTAGFRLIVVPAHSPPSSVSSSPPTTPTRSPARLTGRRPWFPPSRPKEAARAGSAPHSRPSPSNSPARRATPTPTSSPMTPARASPTTWHGTPPSTTWSSVRRWGTGPAPTCSTSSTPSTTAWPR